MQDSIKVSAVVIRNDDGEVLTVRKVGTELFMLPGGKPEPGEDSRGAAVRECHEELGAVLDPRRLRYLGTFTAAAANEPGRIVEAVVFEHPNVTIGEPQAEIEACAWTSPGMPGPGLAPLLRDAVFPAISPTRL